MTEIIHLSFDEAVLIYEEIMKSTNCKPIFRDTAMLEHIISSCEKLFNSEKDSVLFKAAYLMKEIISKHPFMDGNKRGALSIADGFLKLNGCNLILAIDDVKFLEEIDSKKLRVGTVKKFLEKRCFNV